MRNHYDLGKKVKKKSNNDEIYPSVKFLPHPEHCISLFLYVA